MQHDVLLRDHCAQCCNIAHCVMLIIKKFNSCNMSQRFTSEHGIYLAPIIVFGIPLIISIKSHELKAMNTISSTVSAKIGQKLVKFQAMPHNNCHNKH